MVSPLFARAKYSKIYPELFVDNEAEIILEKVLDLHPEATAEFSATEELIDEFMGLNFIIRAKTFDEMLNNYIKQHPKTTVVNLGCGLDTTFSRVDNGKITWFDLDLPDAIEYRRKLIPDSTRSISIPKSVFDLSWINTTNYKEKDGIFLIAGGLFSYFKEEDVAKLFVAMADKLPAAELLFDCQSSLGNKIINRRLKKLNVEGVHLDFNVKNPVKHIQKWSDKIEVVDWFTLFSRTERNPKWKKRTHLLMNLCDWLNAGKFVHVKFLS